MKKRTLFIICLLLSTFFANAQSNYQTAWEYLNKADFENAELYFLKATKDKQYQNQANLVLSMIYSSTERPEKASKYFNAFYENVADPSAELFALWEDEGVIGSPKKLKPFQVELLNKIAKDDKTKNRFAATVNYLSIINQIYQNKKEGVDKLDENLPTINNWSVLGPFDNVMNSGFDKNIEIVKKNPEKYMFKSKYGADITWLPQENCTSHGYYVSRRNFVEENAVIYAQSFIESPEEQEVILKFSYSSSLRIWLNDSLAYSEIEKRNVQMDYYQIKCHLNKGFNRVLVQLGDYNETFPNFALRFVNIEDKNLKLNSKAIYNEYQKNKYPFQRINFFATEMLKKKYKKMLEIFYTQFYC